VDVVARGGVERRALSLSRGQAVLAGEPVADRPLVNARAVDLAGIKPDPAVVDESRDRVVIKPVLARPRGPPRAMCASRRLQRSS
jgi:hypothetical protein